MSLGKKKTDQHNQTKNWAKRDQNKPTLNWAEEDKKIKIEKAVETLACGSCSHSISRSPKPPLVFL